MTSTAAPQATPVPQQPSARTLDDLFPLVYAELRRVAHARLRAECEGHTLNTTALVHDAYLRLADQARSGEYERGYLLSLATLAMRRVLVDHARRRGSAKRGGGCRPLPLEGATLAAEDRADTIVALDEALERLELLEPRLCRVVECRFFSGLTEEETARVLQVTTRTIQRDWAKAKAWLYRELDD